MQRRKDNAAARREASMPQDDATATAVADNEATQNAAAEAEGGGDLESRVSALEEGGGEDVTQPSPTVDVPVSPEEGVGAAPAMPEPTMGAAEKMFGGGAIRQIAMGAGKFKK